MKIAIISDIHDNLANLERFLEMFKGEAIICCGDVATVETLEWLATNFEGPIKLVCGNAEIGREQFAEVATKHKNLEIFADSGAWEIEGFKLAFVHQPSKIDLALRQAQSESMPEFIFYGHTHKPWIRIEPEDRLLGAVQRRSSGTVIANPGTLGGVFTSATFAILDTQTGKLELKKLY
jgi:putative phosphoesterase